VVVFLTLSLRRTASQSDDFRPEMDMVQFHDPNQPTFKWPDPPTPTRCLWNRPNPANFRFTGIRSFTSKFRKRSAVVKATMLCLLNRFYELKFCIMMSGPDPAPWMDPTRVLFLPRTPRSAETQSGSNAQKCVVAVALNSLTLRISLCTFRCGYSTDLWMT